MKLNAWGPPPWCLLQPAKPLHCHCRVCWRSLRLEAHLKRWEPEQLVITLALERRRMDQRDSGCRTDKVYLLNCIWVWGRILTNVVPVPWGVFHYEIPQVHDCHGTWSISRNTPVISCFCKYLASSVYCMFTKAMLVVSQVEYFFRNTWLHINEKNFHITIVMCTIY